MVAGVTTGRLLGAGSHAQVWSGVEADSGRQVALKVLDLDAERLDGAGREIRLLRRIEHDHVVRLLRVDRSACGRTVMVLERAAGGSLRALVGARGRLDPGEVVTVLTPLAQALGDLHGRGLVHGDVTPGNVLFADGGRPLLADLGVGRVLGLEAAIHGTPGFVDPVLALGGLPTPAGDVYSLGAVAWFALTGRSPGTAGERAPLTSLVPTTPFALASVVEGCLDPDPSSRPGAAALAADVYGAATAEPVRLVPTDAGADAAEVLTHRLRREATQPAAAEAVPRGRRPRVVPAVAAAVVGVVVVGGGGVWLGVNQNSPRGADTGARDRTRFAASVGAEGAEMVHESPVAALTRLSDARAQAFSRADVEAVRRVNVPGSGALDADLATLEALGSRGVVLRGPDVHRGRRGAAQRHGGGGRRPRNRRHRRTPGGGQHRRRRCAGGPGLAGACGHPDPATRPGRVARPGGRRCLTGTPTRDAARESALRGYRAATVETAR